MKICVLIPIVLLSFKLVAQTVVPVGSGSYASAPLASENITAFATQDVNVPAGNTKPIPTNDWWTDVLMNQYAGNLHAYPVTINPENYGCQLIFPVNWVGSDMEKDFPLGIKGTGFAPVKNIVRTGTIGG